MQNMKWLAYMLEASKKHPSIYIPSLKPTPRCAQDILWIVQEAVGTWMFGGW